jgi:hypothetical protein
VCVVVLTVNKSFRFHSMRGTIIRQMRRYQCGRHCRKYFAVTFPEWTGRLPKPPAFGTPPSECRRPWPSSDCASFAALSGTDLDLRLCTFQESFVVARDCIDDLVNTHKDDQFYEDNLAFAKDAVKSAIEDFIYILQEVDEDEKERIMRGHGLNVKRLKGELELAIKGGNSDDADK